MDVTTKLEGLLSTSENMTTSGLVGSSGMHALEIKGARNHDQAVLRIAQRKKLCAEKLHKMEIIEVKCMQSAVEWKHFFHISQSMSCQCLNRFFFSQELVYLSERIRSLLTCKQKKFKTLRFASGVSQMSVYGKQHNTKLQIRKHI